MTMNLYRCRRKRKKAYILTLSVFILGFATVLAIAGLFGFYNNNPESTSAVVDNLKMLLVRSAVEDSVQDMFDRSGVNVTLDRHEISFVHPVPLLLRPFYTDFNAYLAVLQQSENDVLVDFSLPFYGTNLTLENENLFVRYRSRNLVQYTPLKNFYQRLDAIVIEMEVLDEKILEDSFVFMNCGEGEYNNCNSPSGINVTLRVVGVDGGDDVSGSIVFSQGVVARLYLNHTRVDVDFGDAMGVETVEGEGIITVRFVYEDVERLIEPHLYMNTPDSVPGVNELVKYRFGKGWVSDRLSII